MCIFTSRYLCSTRAVDNQTPLIDAHENLAIALREGGYEPGLMGYNDYAVDPRTLPPEDPRTHTLSYDNFLPGLDVLLDHEYDSRAYFEMLREKGYPEERLNHKAIHTPNIPPEGPGDHLPLFFPAQYKTEDSECRFMTNTAIEYIQDQSQTGWVLSLNYIKPHPPSICSSPYHAMYNPADMPSPNRNPQELASEHPYLEYIHQNPRLVSERDLRETQANYYGMISELDASLGLLFQAIKDAGQWDRTLIIFSADHGEYLGDHYLSGKGSIFDEAMHVPLIIRDPSSEANTTRGQQLDLFAESIDLAPTILQYLNLPIPDRFQGRSLLGHIRGHSNVQSKSEVYYEKDFRSATRSHPDWHPDRCLLWILRTAQYKYVQFAEESIPPLLFDLHNDPGEHHNLATDSTHTAIVLSCCQKLLRWRMFNEDQRMEHWASQYR
ncbi:MAG: sulfatase-like hydrolase/transferase [bacterium]|nr:sulfatase-like hydrolase/transferase [bacterium]